MSTDYHEQKAGNVLVLINTSSAFVSDGTQYIVPYLDHLGIPFTILDLAIQSLPDDVRPFSLLLLSHRDLTVATRMPLNRIIYSLETANQAGAGILSFDPSIVQRLLKETPECTATFGKTSKLQFSSSPHYITAWHESGETIQLYGELVLSDVPGNMGQTLIHGSGIPLLQVSQRATGRMAVWSTSNWMKTDVLGPLRGLDDCFWRSIVWCAKKPFVMQGQAPIITMRVDDVAGLGQLWNQSPLYWIETANKYGFKPWLGLFIYNLNPEAIDELRGYLLSGQATASPHAFGRPPRTNITDEAAPHMPVLDPSFYEGYYYYPKAIPTRADVYDEFIFFDHHRRVHWSDEIIRQNLDAVDAWYAAHTPLPKSSYFVPHWYQCGLNAIELVVDRWQMAFSAQPLEFGRAYGDKTPWLKGEPFRLHERPGTSAKNPDLRGGHPVYYAHFYEVGNRRFFNCLTEIRDDAGYEWAPDNDVEATAVRGIRQLKRALHSMALPVLFTHETDYIYLMEPENWDAVLRLISESLASYFPLYMTMDDALKVVRATHSSFIKQYALDESNGKIDVYMCGETDVDTYIYVFEETQDGIHSHLHAIPPFRDNTTVIIQAGQ